MLGLLWKIVNLEKCRTKVTLVGHRERTTKNWSLPGKLGGFASMVHRDLCLTTSKFHFVHFYLWPKPTWITFLLASAMLGATKINLFKPCLTNNKQQHVNIIIVSMWAFCSENNLFKSPLWQKLTFLSHPLSVTSLRSSSHQGGLLQTWSSLSSDCFPWSKCPSLLFCSQSIYALDIHLFRSR